ncbi:MAG: Gfo/Idh/MocA family protein [Thermomicrobiales bacterium]
MTRPIRTGLIGCGKIARTHAAALATLPSADFVACCDSDESRVTAFAQQHHVPKTFTDPETMLASGEIDAVLVCTPHPSHAALVVLAAKHGVHVLCEKPMTIDLAQADQMIAAADEAGITFGVVFQRRFWPAAQRIREAIDTGRLGQLTTGECSVRIWRPESYFASDPWRGTWANEGGGVLMNQAIHAVDQFQWFMGPAVEVSGRYATLLHGDYIDVEDTAVATVTFANGALGILHAASTISPDLGFRVAVYGSSGAAASVWEPREGQQGFNDVWTFPDEEPHRQSWETDERGNPGSPTFHHLQLENFIDAVATNRDPLITGREARKSLEIILALYRSSETGAPVKLPMGDA